MAHSLQQRLSGLLRRSRDNSAPPAAYIAIALVLLAAWFAIILHAGATSTAVTTLFGSSVPAQTTTTDSRSVELGMRFTVDTNGYVYGVRFYKGAGNVGTHTGRLWTDRGQLLGQVTFTNETASGWQQATFSQPIAVRTGTRYVVSYFAPAGHYASTPGLFKHKVDNAPLHAPADSWSGHNGVYAYAGAPTFPSQSWQSTGYGVDVVYSTSGSAPAPAGTSDTVAPTTAAPTTAAPTTTTAPATTTPTTAAPTTTTVQPSTTPTTAPSSTSSPSASSSGVGDASNTGPTGTLTPYNGPLTINTPGTVIQNADIVLQDGYAFTVNADNVRIVNSRIRYVGSSTSDSCRFCYGSYTQYRHGLVLDHVEFDGYHRSEYGLRAYGDFTMVGSSFHAASHVIDAFGDPVTHATTTIDHSYIYDSDDKPFATDGTQYQGHSSAVYFSGANSPVRITYNTIITPKYSLGPTAGGHINNATAAVAIYPDEGTVNGSNASYTYQNNYVSGGGYVVTIRCSYGSTCGPINLNFSNNLLTAQSGWPSAAGYGAYNIGPDSILATETMSGNAYGADVTQPTSSNLNAG